jgi:hypothetical protein
MFLLDEQSIKIEEIFDQMKELKEFYFTSMQSTDATLVTNLHSQDNASIITHTLTKPPENVS